MWDQITTGLEDNRAAVTLTAIDYSKAFNRMRHDKCLEAFAKKSASNTTIELLAGFLAGRAMAVKVGSCYSEPLQINAGAHQGSVLGSYLFNIGTDDLKEGVEWTDENESDDLEYMERPGDGAASTRSIQNRADIWLDVSPVRGGQPGWEILPGVVHPPGWNRTAREARFQPRPPLCQVY